MRSFSRVVARLRALSGLGLPPELIVPEMAILMGRALEAATHPAVFVVNEATVAQPHDFTVWLGADQTVRELRLLAKMGVWPGPSGTPSLQTIIAQRIEQRIFAATLWGEGCADEGSWADLWRARGIQHGLQAVCFPGEGRIVIILVARATGTAPFSQADCEFGETVMPFFERAIGNSAPHLDRYEEAVPSVQLVLKPDGKPDTMSFGASEMLRDMGGGGPDAVELMLSELERKAASQAIRPPHAIKSDPFLQMRRKAGNAGSAGCPLQSAEIAKNVFGVFTARFSPLAGKDGDQGQIATLGRQIPRALLALRGALRAGAPARELQLIVALVRGETLESAAAALGLGVSSAKTMLDRIKLRAGAETRAAALSIFVERGRAASW